MCRRSSSKRILVGLVVLVAGITVAGSGAFGHGVSDSDQAAMADGSNWDFVVLGARHMVTGYDHLLFLFGVMFFLTRFGEIVKFITAFTLGHTITLIAATYAGIQANYFMVDAVIACTVAYKGVDNLDGFRKYLSVAPPNLLAAVFIFGLIHGFGLSTRLQQLPILGDGLLLRIISFNVGVELGQIAALAVMLAVLSLWRHTPSFAKFSGLANSGLIAAGCLLLLMQLHGYSHTQYPNEFGFPDEIHAHTHEDGLEAAPDGQHTHEDGSTHEDHQAETAPDAAPEGEHTHDDGSTHADHEDDSGDAAPEGQHVHEDGSVHADHEDDSAEAAPEGQHVHEDGSVHADHDDDYPRFDDEGLTIIEAAPEAADAQSDEDDHDHPHDE